ncbi:extracellular matrix protein 1-like [Scomber japonicus]|uniref:extracellular matrix protein 1-like n=1 Tax=Scomber japonicus TaxID=13676 RepID=UPI002306AA06|nr:extracellular matrix protein 1-like [Scomber japonicus]
MILIGGLTGFWIFALMTLHSANLGETNPLNEPDVPFPPGFPTAENIAAICHHGNGRPRYPDSFFPGSGVSHWKRRGNAINKLESWYSLCCSGAVVHQSSQILCCSQQAWKQALSEFCVAEYSTMTRAYECCRKKGDERWSCFDSELPNPNYDPTPGYTAPQLPLELGFSFNADAC